MALLHDSGSPQRGSLAGVEKPILGFLFCYSILLLAETVLIRHPFTGKHFQPELLWSWKAWAKQRNPILTNAAMFIPIGILAGRLLKWKGLWIVSELSLTVEFLQLVTSRGLMEFDDVIHNMIGAAIGIGIVMIQQLIRNKEI